MNTEKSLPESEVAAGTHVREYSDGLVFICKEILKFVVNMFVDDDKKLTRFTKKKIVDSDHSPLILNLDMKPPEKSPKRMEIFN